MKKSVRSAKMAACMNPIKTSNKSIGTGTTSGTKCLTTRRSTHPAKIFPKRRNENDIKRATSEKSSMIPVKNPKTELRLTNFLPYFKKPIVATPKISITKNEIIAKARVTFKSVFMGRKSAVNSPSLL